MFQEEVCPFRLWKIEKAQNEVINPKINKLLQLASYFIWRAFDHMHSFTADQSGGIIADAAKSKISFSDRGVITPCGSAMSLKRNLLVLIFVYGAEGHVPPVSVAPFANRAFTLKSMPLYRRVLSGDGLSRSLTWPSFDAARL